MNAQQFLSWMQNPGITSREESAQLDALLVAFPYFQSGHLLYIKNLHNQGSFLYNNQLKTAAAYAVNRKVLYELITLKADTSAANSAQSSLGTTKSVADKIVSSTRSDNTVSQTEEEKVNEPIKFPPKKFTSNPDEWEAGMLRQLQLLHHWKKTGDEIPILIGREVGEKEFGIQDSRPGTTILKSDEKKTDQETPAAKDEINTLLYVLVEPGQPEDLSAEASDEVIADVSEESESTHWEITPAQEEKSEPIQEIVKPADPVQQEILVEAIHSSFEMEVDDKLPSVDELKPFRIESTEVPVTEIPEPTEPIAEDQVVTSFENMSFSDWIKEVNKKAPAALPKTILSEDKLIEQFIKEEPRIQVKKSGFYNPVNMAKKSVQDSDEFITETLARIYAKQGNISKAIRAYQKLSLKFPEKTAYFAALIEELKRTPDK